MAERRAPRTVLIDCDPGTDDTIALLLALASSELHVAAITVVGGNVPLAQTLANARGIVGLAGVDVPLYAGSKRALLGAFPSGWPGHGENGVAGVMLPPGPRPRDEVAADAIRSLLRGAERPLTLVGIGPATNLALALATEPALAARVEEIVLLSGARGRGNATEAAEFNAWCDPEALAIVLDAGTRLTLATIESAAGALVTPERIGALRRSGGGRALALACAILAALPPSPRFGGKGTPLYDPLTIAWLLRPELFQTEDVIVRVGLAPGPDRGRTLIEGARPGAGIRSARLLARVDTEGFFALLAQRLAELP